MKQKKVNLIMNIDKVGGLSKSENYVKNKKPHSEKGQKVDYSSNGMAQHLLKIIELNLPRFEENWNNTNLGLHFASEKIWSCH